jgi:tetratricopeptide (TPR) repeat protein
VTQANSQSILAVDFQHKILRVVLLLPAILALVGCWFAIHWYLGDTIAEFAPDAERGGREVARLAVKWAPDDPLTHLMLGDLEMKEFGPDQIADAVREYETAVSLAPNDYRYWTQLGRALEATGDSDRAEKALRRSVELAPAYSYPRWYLGNLLLRAGKQDEAFRELVRASQADPQLLPQVFNLTWEIFGGNAGEIAKTTCPTPFARAQLAIYLVNRKEFDQAARIWAAIPARDRRALDESGEELKKLLMEAERFHYVLDVMRDLETDLSRIPEPEKFFNGGFESDTAPRRTDKFGWAIVSSAQAQTAVDYRDWHSGHGSLKIIFKSPTNLNAINVSQLVVVEPDTQYRLECYARTEDLHTGGAPVVEIRDAMDHNVLATSQPLPDGTNNWQPITVEFKTKPQMEGVIVRLGRATCGQDSFCPIFGTVWYDDFDLQRFSGPAGIRSDAGDGTRNRNAARTH